MKPKLRLTSRGWFRVINFATGTVNIRTGVVLPDRDGLTMRRIEIGPYPSAEAAVHG